MLKDARIEKHTHTLRVGGAIHALVNNAAISPKDKDRLRLDSLNTDLDLWRYHGIPCRMGYRAAWDAGRAEHRRAK